MHYRVGHMVGGSWQNDAICNGPKDLEQYLVRLANKPKITTIRVDPCDKHGELLQ